ncbi:hypothetical protein IWW36_001900 [Coemansia brasiliensis]|uniref:Myb-like domain-containing protein n=1 Tax=Coemansia brasiliensis TaxID=2650707 RepID=A0A9W8IAR2_9FUNG|nr:hypothetical protein IWW36_001900 [Coemansia brasiliensis]
MRLFSTSCFCQIRSQTHSKWTAEKAAELIDYIKTNYSGKVSGNWDYVISEIQKTPLNRGNRWTSAEITKLKQYVWENYAQYGLYVDDWNTVANKFNRSATSCYTMYYKAIFPEEKFYKSHGTAAKPVRVKETLTGEMLAYANKLQTAIKKNMGPKGPFAVKWSDVAHELNKPLFEVLLSTDRLLRHKGRLIPMASLQHPADPDILSKMQQFIKAHFKDKPTIDWDIVSLYLCIDPKSCAIAYTKWLLAYAMPSGVAGHSYHYQKNHNRWTTEEIERLNYAATNRDKFPLWKHIAAYVGNGRSLSSCYIAWKNQQNHKAVWTSEEKQLLSVEIEKMQGKLDWDKLLPLFPGKTKAQLTIKADAIQKKKNYTKTRQIAESKAQLLFDAVAKNTDIETDWIKVSDVVGISPANCRSYYLMFKQRQGKAIKWSKEELSRLQYAANMIDEQTANRWEIVAQMVGTRTAAQCGSKFRRLQNSF